MVDKKVPFKSVPDMWAAEDVKLAELKQSDKIEDQLTAALMEPHTEDNSEEDPVGLWHNFAHHKARVILKRFNVTPKNESSPLPKGKV